MTTSLGQPDPIAISGFLIFIALSLGITWWAARRTRTTAAGRSAFIARWITRVR